MTSFALAHNFRDCRHDTRHHGLPVGKPIAWNRVHALPDYVYFDHSIHVAKGVGCTTCHGQVDEMPLMKQAQPMTMGWCLDSREHLFGLAPPAHKPGSPVAHRTIGQVRGIDVVARHELTALFVLVERRCPGKLSRRAALQLIAGGVASLAAGCKEPDEKIVAQDTANELPYVHLPEGLLPGIAKHYATTLPLAGYGRGAIVTAFEGRPTKVEGNPSHPASLGGTDVFAQAEILGLYDPDRSQTIRLAGEIADLDSISMKRPRPPSGICPRRTRSNPGLTSPLLTAPSASSSR
jgi:hypothetical protein